jgi:osmotically-inducible protein OsmY
MKKRTDDAITGDIVAAFGASPDVNATEIRAHTRLGRIRLEGVVNTLEEKSTAARIAACVPGVRSIENDLVVASDMLISDLDIEQAVAEELAGAGLTEVGVAVEAGTAFLMGVVPSLAVEQEASEIASSVRGVRDVVSNLAIAAGEPIDDTKLANDVAEALSDDPRLEITDLEVRAENGLVILLGGVVDPRQLPIATEVTASVAGVKGVETRIEILESSS